MLIPQELRNFDTANTRHNMKIMSSASFILVNVWLVNPIRIRREEARVANGVNIGYVSHDQMAWNLINGTDISFWSSVCIWFSITTSLSLIFFWKTQFLKNAEKMQLLTVDLSRKALMAWNLAEVFIYFIKYSSWGIFG